MPSLKVLPNFEKNRMLKKKNGKPVTKKNPIIFHGGLP
jgi:hypothetical protein